MNSELQASWLITHLHLYPHTAHPNSPKDDDAYSGEAAMHLPVTMQGYSSSHAFHCPTFVHFGLLPLSRSALHKNTAPRRRCICLRAYLLRASHLSNMRLLTRASLPHHTHTQRPSYGQTELPAPCRSAVRRLFCAFGCLMTYMT